MIEYDAVSDFFSIDAVPLPVIVPVQNVCTFWGLRVLKDFLKSFNGMKTFDECFWLYLNYPWNILIGDQIRISLKRVTDVPTQLAILKSTNLLNFILLAYSRIVWFWFDSWRDI